MHFLEVNEILEIPMKQMFRKTAGWRVLPSCYSHSARGGSAETLGAPEFFELIADHLLDQKETTGSASSVHDIPPCLPPENKYL